MTCALTLCLTVWPRAALDHHLALGWDATHDRDVALGHHHARPASEGNAREVTHRGTNTKISHVGPESASTKTM